MIAKQPESARIGSVMTRLRLLLLLVICSVIGSMALLLPGCFKNPRELVLGEWQEVNKLGYVEVTDSTARWRGGNYKATFHYTWVQDADEPYTVEVSRNGENWQADITFESDNEADVYLHVFDKLPPEAQDFIRQKNKARNRPENELRMRFRRVLPEK